MNNRDIDIMNVFFDYYDELTSSHLVEGHTGNYEKAETINVVLAALLTIFKESKR